MKGKLLELTKNSAVVFLLGFLPAPFLVSAGYPPLLVCIFSISIMLLWSDGLLTLFAIGKGATEINPIVKFLNWIAGKKRGVLLSRIVGSILPIIGLLENNLYFVLAIAWLFAAVVCLNSITLFSVFDEKVNAN
jgi:hypothetical protein